MLSKWIILLLAAPALLLLQSLVSLARNYRIAKKTGLPVVVSPINISNPVWMVLGGLVGPLLLKAPLGLGAWVRCGRWGWLWEDQGALHRELGKVIINVDPKKLRVRLVVGALVFSYLPNLCVRFCGSLQGITDKKTTGVMRRRGCHQADIRQQEGLRERSGGKGNTACSYERWNLCSRRCGLAAASAHSRAPFQ